MSAAFADPPRGSGPRAGGETWSRARARRICARALALALDPTVDTATAATELAVLAGGDPSAVVRAIAFVRTAGARPSPVNDRAERALVATLAALVADRAAGRPDRPERDP
jgi:hypothetical protein